MKRVSIVLLIVLSSGGVGFWLGQAHADRRARSDARPSVSGSLNVVGIGGPLEAASAVLSNSLAVDGDLQIHSLPDGKVALAGNLNVRPN